MRHSWSISDSPDLPIRAFHKALGKNRPATLEGGKGGGPSAPNPWEASAAQTAMNRDTAVYNKALNLGNYSNPFGSQQSSFSGYDQVTGAPIYQTNISANPQLQSLLAQQLAGIGQSQGGLQNAMSGLQGLESKYAGLQSNLGALGQNYNTLNQELQGMDASGAMQRGQDAYYKQATSFLDPQFAQQGESLEASLAAKGLTPGSEAYNRAMGDFQREKSFAYNQAANSAITQGQQLGLNQLSSDRDTIAQRAGLSQAQQGSILGQSGLLGQLGGLFGQQIGANQLGYQNLNSIASLIPGYTGIGQSATNPADIMGAMNNQYQGQLGQYNARQQSSNANTAALAGLAGTAAMMFF